MEEKVIVEFTDAEISDVVSSIDNAPIDGYGNITKNRRIYSTPFKKLKKIANEKLAAILRKHYSLEDTIESFKESESLGFGLTLDVTLDSLSQLKITLKNEQQELSTKVVDLSFVQKCEQSAKEHADNAETAKEAAELAKSDAEKAKGDAETAKNAAEAAREAAEIFSATAQTHANNASTDATAAANSATTAQEAAKEAKIYAIRAEEALEGVGNFIPGELGEDGKFYPFDKDTGQVSTSALAAPSAGVVYFDLFSNKLYTWDSATGSYILQADLNATGGGGSLDPSVLADYVKNTQFSNYAEAGIVYTPSGDENYNGGIYFKDGKALIVGSARSGKLSDAFFDNPKVYSVPVLSNDLYRWIKVGLVQNTEDWTDDDKAAACETVGATPFPKQGTENGAFTVLMPDGKIKKAVLSYSNWPSVNCVPVYNSNKTIIVNNAVNDTDAPNWRQVITYVDGLQKFTHYITIGSIDENSPANVNLQITNYDDISLAGSESIYDFSQLASAIDTMLEASEENPSSVSASGSIIYNGALHLVLSATTKEGGLILKTFDTSVQELAEIKMEEPYYLIDKIIKKEI